MIANNSENKKALVTRVASAYLPVTVKPETLEALNKIAKQTGNRSLIVEKAIRLYLGLEDTPEKLAS